MNGLVKRITDYIAERALVSDGSRLLVAVSGGLDSMVLLHLLHRMAKQFDWGLTVAHYNHRLRGRSSNADQALVERSAKRLKLPMLVGSGDPRWLMASERISLEMAARKLRHEFLARTAKEIGAKSIALGHHADDQVELFFLRLLRGSSPEGLSGMRWISPSPANRSIQLVRPLLDATKADLVSYAKEERIPFREDASNRCLDMQRNRLRHKLLPLLRRSFQPALTRTILRTMELLAAESDYVSSSVRAWSGAYETAWPPGSFQGAALALQRRLIQEGLIGQGIAPSFELIEDLRRNPEKPVGVANGVQVVLRAGGKVCRLEREPNMGTPGSELEVCLDAGRGQVVFEGLTVRWDRRKLAGCKHIISASGQEWFDAEKVGRSVLLRHWRPGDRFQPAGMPSSVKLQDLFTNLKVPRARRHKLVVAVAGSGQIFWVEGLRISEQFKLCSETTHRLRWRWQRDNLFQASSAAASGSI